MKKSKWSGADLMRSEVLERQQHKAVVEESQPAQSKLARIRTRKVMKGPDGEVIDLTPSIPIWLVQMDAINQILLGDVLTTNGYDISSYEQLHELPHRLSEALELPRLIIIEARAIGQQTPFFRKMILPVLQDLQVPCLITGVHNELQERSFRSWYDGPITAGGDLDQVLANIQALLDR